MNWDEMEDRFKNRDDDSERPEYGDNDSNQEDSQQMLGEDGHGQYHPE